MLQGRGLPFQLRKRIRHGGITHGFFLLPFVLQIARAFAVFRRSAAFCRATRFVIKAHGERDALLGALLAGR